MSKDNDEPAFPVPDQPHSGGLNGYYGMSLRDYFAAKFAAAWVQALALRWKEPGCSDFDIMLEANRRGLDQADAMLAERAK